MQFSNHTGYKSFTGEVLQGEQLLKLVAVSAPSLTHCTEALISVRALTALSPGWLLVVQGMESNGLLTGYTHLLTGYIGSESFLAAVMDVLKKLKVSAGLLTGPAGVG